MTEDKEKLFVDFKKGGMTFRFFKKSDSQQVVDHMSTTS